MRDDLTVLIGMDSVVLVRVSRHHLNTLLSTAVSRPVRVLFSARASILLRICFALIATALDLAASNSFFVDPDYSGSSSDGSAAHPWTELTSTTWQAINSSLSTGDVTVYLSALKAGGTQQQSKSWFLEVRRNNPSANRLTIDGYTYYNSDTGTPSWRTNPSGNIANAYTNGQVFQLVGNGSQALGWSREAGNDLVTSGGLTYACIRSHAASPSNQPGVGTDWQRYWDRHDSGGGTWISGAAYACYAKQDNITLRGFELTGNGARAGFAGDNFILEYVNSHDITSIGPAINLLYTSYPDNSSAAIIIAKSTNIVLRNFRIDTCNGEAVYLGAINPDAPQQFQCDHGNQYDQVTISNFLIRAAGTGGGQGDGIDCKNGITNLKISTGEIGNLNNSMGAIVCPQTFANADQGLLIEKVYIHDITTGSDNRTAVYLESSMLSCSLAHFKGYYGVTVRNCIIANCSFGIQVFSLGSVRNIKIQNNTIYRVGGYGIYADSSDGSIQVRNNLVLDCNGGGEQAKVIGSWSDSRNNAYNNSWSGPCLNCKENANVTTDFVDPAAGDFRVKSRTAIQVGAALALTDFADDFYGNRRSALSWDIGAAQRQTSTAPPSPPQNLRFVSP
jgi:hypothetical protein